MKLIIFDIVGVIIPNLKGGSKKCIKNLYDSLPNQSISFDEFYGRYNKFIIGSISKNKFWENIKGDIDTIEKKYLDTYEIIPNLDKIIIPLKKKYRIIALSNHPAPWMQYIISKFHLDKIFEMIYVSGKVGMKKPQEKLFLKIINDFNVNPTECIFIDDQNKNLAAASKLGFKTIHFGIDKGPINFKSDFKINSLTDLKFFLKF